MALTVFVGIVVVRQWNSVLLVSRGRQRQLHVRLTERELNGIAVINFPGKFSIYDRRKCQGIYRRTTLQLLQTC